MDEERHAFLKVDHRIRGGDPCAVGDDRAGVAVFDVPCPRFVACGDGVGDAGTVGQCQEGAAEADEPAGWHGENHADPAGAVVGHLLHASLTGGKQLCHATEVVLRGVDRDFFHRFVDFAVDLACHNLGLADREFEAFAAHLLHEDRKRELAAALDLPRIWALGW